PEQARAMVQALPSFMTQLLPASDLTDRALAIAMMIRHPVYDCLYIACAEVGEGILVTADKRLCAVVRDTAFGHLVHHLSDAAL
ncbi:MAG: type II toxin-antitoxin system VapC family toxin, partial [Kiloniellales bacterium]